LIKETEFFPLQATYQEHYGTLEGIKRAAVISGESPSAAPQATLFDVPGEADAEEPCEGLAHAGGDLVPAKATFVEDTKAFVEKIKDDDETSVGTGGSTTDDGEEESGPSGTRGRKTTRPPYIDTNGGNPCNGRIVRRSRSST
jgi:hypothetical protein